MSNSKPVSTIQKFRVTLNSLTYRATTFTGLDNLSYAWAWGANANGTIGDNTVTLRSSPVSVVGDKQWSSIAQGFAGETYVVGLDNLSYAWAWGVGTTGQLGDNTVANKSSPVSVVGGKQWINLKTSGNGNATLALDSSSYAWCWGAGTQGTMGDNTNTSKSSPVSVVGDRQWIAISAGGTTCVALDASSYAWCWGQNTSGQIGDNSVASRSSPVSVLGGLQFIYIRSFSTVMVGLDGLSYAWAWGTNASGQLGDNSLASRSSPVSVVGGRQWLSIVPADNGGYLLGIDGLSYAWAWGANTNGCLGDNNAIGSRSSPVSVVGGRQWRTLAGASSSTCGLDSQSYAWAWGTNTSGQLGDNTITNRSSPVSMLIGRQVVSLLANNSATDSIAVDADGLVWASGLNASGQLCEGTVAARSSPVSIRVLKQNPTNIFGRK